MTSNEILKADVLDILFDNRNKQYGAYILRKNYNSRLGLALAISLSSMLLFFLITRLDSSARPVEDKVTKPELVIDHLIPPEIKKPDPIIPKKVNSIAPIRTERLTTIEIKPDHVVTTTVPDQNSLSTNAISNIKLDGIPSLDIAVVKESGPANVVKEQPKTVSEYAPVEREPEFPGGQTAWLNFLQKNLMVPEQLESGDKKMVSIRFQCHQKAS